MKPSRTHVLLACAFALIAACVFFASGLGPWSQAPVRAMLLLLLAGAGWLAALIRARRSAPSVRAILAGAILLRLFALGSSLHLSDDVGRYLWEGELVLRGTSPYAFAPDDPALAGVREELPLLDATVAHREVAAAYPPLVQLLGALVAWVARAMRLAPEVGGVLVLRVLVACADLLVLLPLARLAQRTNPGGAERVRAALVVWAWCPLVVLEFAGSGHVDAVGILLFLAALLALARADERDSVGLDARAAGWLAAAVLVKYLPLVVLPWIGPGGRAGVPRALGRIGLLVLLVGLGFVPFLFLRGAERGFGGGLSEYGLRWESGSLVFRFVESVCLALFDSSNGWDDPRRVARYAVAALWIAWVAWVVFHVRDRVRGVGLSIAGFLLLTPALHPWYLAWMVPFVALHPSRAWTWLLLAAPILYAPLAGWQLAGRWSEPAWMWPALALPFFTLLVLGRSGRRQDVRA